MHTGKGQVSLDLPGKHELYEFATFGTFADANDERKRLNSAND